MVEVHPTCCDCDSCLNGSGGQRLAGTGVTTATPGDKPPRRRLALNERLAEALREEEQAMQRMHYFRRVASTLTAQDGGR